MIFFKKNINLLICIFIVVMTLSVYGQVKDHQFISLDDMNYVVDNVHLRAGFSVEGLKWAFTAFHASNWHPLTWLSLMADYQIFGLNPGGYHLLNLLIHIVSSVLLFLILRKMTRRTWPSAAVALLFAVHPLHVESVVWISERKDVLCGLFWIITMGAYFRYTEKKSIARYLMLVSCFVLALMSKPMAVTLPFVLLIMDFWPLGRLQTDYIRDAVVESTSFADGKSIKFKHKKEKSKKKITSTEFLISKQKKSETTKYSQFFLLFWEKLPLFIISILSMILTLAAQKNAVHSLEITALPLRLANALIAYVTYVVKTFIPVRLAVFYPYPDGYSPAFILGAVLILGSITAVAVIHYNKRPYLLAGWFWYLGGLVPVIGFVQVGGQSMADRYTYLPHIGLFIMGVWLIDGIWPKKSLYRYIAVIVCCLYLALLLGLSFKQVSHWRNDITLFQHALSVTENNFLAHNSLGVAYLKAGNTEEGIRHLKHVLDIKPNHADAYINLGAAMLYSGNLDQAVFNLSKAAELKPADAGVYNNLGIALRRQGKWEDSIRCYEKAIEIKPSYAEAYNNLGVVFLHLGQNKDALNIFQKALLIKPDYAIAMNNVELAKDRIAMEHSR